VTAVLFAHQGGWDEILMVLVPIALFAGLLAVANRRANSIDNQRHDGGRAGRDAGEPGVARRRGDGPTPR
jgi:hypothetical protein